MHPAKKRSRIILSLLALLMTAATARAQFADASSGLLQMPSAEMQADGTFMITNNFLNRHATSTRWNYHTFQYGDSVWDNRFEAMFELQNFQWVSFGLRYKLRLKK